VHTPKTSCWEDSAYFVVGLQYNSRSDHQGCNDHFQIKFLTVGGAGILTGLDGGQAVNNTEAGGPTGHLWRSDHPRIGAGSLTTRGSFIRLKINVFQKSLLQGFQRFKFRDHLEIFTDQREERSCSLGILDNILTRIRNLSKVATIH
jgi:hypothetical protein